MRKYVDVLVFKQYLSKCFHIKDLCSLKYVLGIEVARNSTSLFLFQRKYALDIISEVGKSGARPGGLPLDQNHPFRPRILSSLSRTINLFICYKTRAFLLCAYACTIHAASMSGSLGYSSSSCLVSKK